MKILEFPKRQSSDWKLKTHCSAIHGESARLGCSALVELTIEDVFKVEERTPFNHSISWKWKCPVCGQENLIPQKALPDNVTFIDRDKWMAAKRDNLLFQIANEHGHQAMLAAAEDANVEREILRRLNLIN